MNLDTDLVYVPCDLCRRDDYEVLFAKEGFRHVRCRGCGLVFVNPRLARHLENQTVSGTGEMGEEQLSRPQTRRLRKELASLDRYRKLNRVLEVGAGRGWFLSEAAKAGWEAWAVEINASALQRLRNRGISRIVNQPAEAFEVPAAAFDIVRMWDVIEHLQSPTKAVTNVMRSLRPGGLLLISTTNFASLSRWVNGPEWVYLNGADHIVLFEPATIARLLSGVGFSSIRIRTRSFNMRRKLYHPEIDLPPSMPVPGLLRKLIDETMRFTKYGHQMIVEAVKPEAPAG